MTGTYSLPGWFYKDPNYKQGGSADSQSVFSGRAFMTHGLHLSGQRILVQIFPFKDKNLFFFSDFPVGLSQNEGNSREE